MNTKFPHTVQMFLEFLSSKHVAAFIIVLTAGEVHEALWGWVIHMLSVWTHLPLHLCMSPRLLCFCDHRHNSMLLKKKKGTRSVDRSTLLFANICEVLQEDDLHVQSSIFSDLLSGVWLNFKMFSVLTHQPTNGFYCCHWKRWCHSFLLSYKEAWFGI